MDKNKKACKGSLTVEAALVFPIFIFAMIAFLSLFRIMLIQGRIQWALMETSLEASRYAYVYLDVMKEEQQEKQQRKNAYKSVLNHLEEGIFYKQCFDKYMKNREGKLLYNQNFLTGNISFLESAFLKDGEHVDVIASYQIKLPIQLLPDITYTFVQRSRVRGFIGTSRFGIGNENGMDSEEDTMVYITDTGTVYHWSEDCTHLKLSISNVNFSEIKGLRNQNGGKYKPCEKCIGETGNVGKASVYIAKEGDRYHINRKCSGLKRTIKEIKLSETEGELACSRCGAMPFS